MEVLSQGAYIGDARSGPNPINAVIRYIPLLLLAGFLAELASIIVVGRWLGVLPALGLVVLGAIIGVRVIRSAGMSLAEALRQDPLKRGPAEGLRRVLLAGAGLLLIVPGFLSDAAALVLLIPWTRQWLALKLAGRTWGSRAPRAGPFRGPVIEGEAVEIEVEPRELPPVP